MELQARSYAGAGQPSGPREAAGSQFACRSPTKDPIVNKPLWMAENVTTPPTCLQENPGVLISGVKPFILSAYFISSL